MLSNSIGNILKVVHESGCTYEVAKKALSSNNSWPEAIKYAKEYGETL